MTVPLGGSDIEVVDGVWKETAVNGEDVILHDGDKWPGGAGFPVALFKSPRTFESGTVTVEFKLLKGSDDYSAGLIFGYRDKAAYYVRYNTKDGNVALWRLDGPKRAVIKHGEAHAQLEKDVWHTLELAVDGRSVKASVNGGKLPVEHELTGAPVGKLGLWVKPDVTTAFRNLRVTRR